MWEGAEQPRRAHDVRIAIRLSLIALCIALGSAAGLAQAAWETFQGDSAHTGYVPVSLDPALFTPAWSRVDGYQSDFEARPVVAGDGIVYRSFDSYAGIEQLYAHDAATGSVLWQKIVYASSPYSSLNGSSPPALKDGKVYWALAGSLASPPAGLHAYDAVSGAELFQAHVASSWMEYGAPVVDGGKVYSELSGFANLNQYDATTGHIDWYASLPVQHGWSPAVDQQHLYLYLGANGASPGPAVGTFYAINRTTGALDYKILDFSSVGANNDDHRMDNPMLGTQNDAFVLTNGALIRFDLVNHTKSWEINESFAAGLALHNGQVFGAADGALEVRDELTGNLLWEWQPPSGNILYSNVVLTDTHAFVTSYVPYSQGPSRTYAIDLATHTSVWSIPTGGDLALADHWLYIQDSDFYHSKTTFTAVFLGVPEPGAFFLGLIGLVITCGCRRSRQGDRA
jgi:outer membrane protein assembly factor BamB